MESSIIKIVKAASIAQVLGRLEPELEFEGWAERTVRHGIMVLRNSEGTINLNIKFNQMDNAYGEAECYAELSVKLDPKTQRIERRKDAVINMSRAKPKALLSTVTFEKESFLKILDKADAEPEGYYFKTSAPDTSGFDCEDGRKAMFFITPSFNENIVIVGYENKKTGKADIEFVTHFEY